MLKSNSHSKRNRCSYSKRAICIIAIIVTLSFAFQYLLLIWWRSSYTNNNDHINFHYKLFSKNQENNAKSVNFSGFLDINLAETLESVKYEDRIDCNRALNENLEPLFDQIFAVISGFSISDELIKSADTNVHFILVGQEDERTDISILKESIEKAWDLTDGSRFHLVFCRDHIGNGFTTTIDRISTLLKVKSEEKGLKAIIYLDFESQYTLWPSMSDLLQGIHISRKNIGYLMANALGAEFIIDLDGSHTLIHPDWLKRENLNGFNNNWKHPVIASLHSNVNNPYVLMGPRTNSDDKLDSSNAMKNIWPRGYPNSEVLRNEVPTFHLIGEIETRLNKRASKENCFHFSNGIIQSLEDEMPDIDSDNENGSPLPVQFHPQSSRLSIHPSQFAPFNAHATIFSRHAFWALLLPGTVDERVSDIWRGYIAQTYLHCTGSLIAFSAPFVKQASREDSNTNKQNQDKSNFASKTHDLIQFLSAYDCKQSSSILSNVKFSNSLPYCLISLYSQLVSRGFLEGKMDITLIREWIKALNSLDYLFPNFHPIKECLPKRDSLYQPSWKFADHSFCDVSQKTSIAPQGRRECGNSLLTVVHLNNGLKDVIPIWLAIWQYVYPNPIFYTTQFIEYRQSGTCILEPTSYFNLACNTKDENGQLAYESMMHASVRYPDYNKYLFIHDDTFIAHNTLKAILNDGFSAICSTSLVDGPSSWVWNLSFQKSFQKLAEQNEFSSNSVYRKYTEKYCPDLYEDETKFTEGKFPYYYTLADFFVLTKSDLEIFHLIINKYLDVDMFSEVSIPILFRCALNAREIPYTTFWDGREGNIKSSKTEICGVNPPQILDLIWKISRGEKNFVDWFGELELLIEVRYCDKTWI